jgi:drug/metabolite transporter (DMT)-like permease
MVDYLLLILMTTIGALAAYLFKSASKAVNLKYLLKDVRIYFGASLYIFSSLINIYVLQNLDYSIVLPFTALTYLWIMVLSKYLLSEAINKVKSIGIVFLLVGLLLIALT